jgi:hypothetical protein
MGKIVKSKPTTKNPSPDTLIKVIITSCRGRSILAHEIPATFSWNARNLFEKRFLYAMFNEITPTSR